MKMAQYILTYDLRKEGRDYKTLYDKLAEFNAVRILESVWCFNRYNTNSKNLRDYFKKFIDENDGLFVANISDWASYNVDGTPNEL